MQRTARALLLAEKDGIERRAVKWKRHLNVIEPTHIKHLLAINNVLISFRTALEQAKQAGRVTLFRLYRGDPKKHRITIQRRNLDGHRYNVSVIPDAVMVIQPPNGKHGVFFVEVDRATMSTSRWQEKATAYLEYFQSGQLEQTWEVEWAVLLTVTTSERRLLSIVQKTAELGGKRGFWFTTADRITPDSALQSLWLRIPELFLRRNEQVEKVGEPKTAKRFSVLDAVE